MRSYSLTACIRPSWGAGTAPNGRGSHAAIHPAAQLDHVLIQHARYGTLVGHVQGGVQRVTGFERLNQSQCHAGIALAGLGRDISIEDAGVEDGLAVGLGSTRPATGIVHVGGAAPMLVAEEGAPGAVLDRAPRRSLQAVQSAAC